jgi:hypothetical protein
MSAARMQFTEKQTRHQGAVILRRFMMARKAHDHSLEHPYLLLDSTSVNQLRAFVQRLNLVSLG